MKTITKTFYVSDEFIREAKKEETSTSWPISFGHGDLRIRFNDHDKYFQNKIQISWQEPERKIEISESEFEKAWDESLISYSMRAEIRFSKEFYNFKQKLFGAEK